MSVKKSKRLVPTLHADENFPAIADAILPATGQAFQDKTEALYHFLVESLTEFAVFAVSPLGLVISWNRGAQHTFGYAENEIVGKHFALIFTPDDRLAGEPANELVTALSGEQTNHDRWHVRKDGTRFWGTNTVAPIFDGAGALLGFAKLVRDSTVSHLALQALSESEERLRLLIESVHEYAIFSVALDGTITSWNSGAQTTFGYTDREIIGRPLALLYTADDRRAEAPALALHTATRAGHYSDERWLVRKDQTRFLSSSKLSQLKRGLDGAIGGFVAIAHDITERRRIADELRRRALNDQLTKLPNRMAFYEHVFRAIASMKRRSAFLFAVLFIDLDHFKAVNDTYGHLIADSVLEFAARRLEACVRSGDIIARLGGDEFAILLNDINDVGDATDAGDRIGVELARPLPIDGYEVHITASVGIALGSAACEKPEDILRDADAAMYTAKTRGRARAVLFDPAMNIASSQNLDLEADLRLALVREQLRIAYQPIVRLADRVTVGFEALVRWNHPRRGLLEPSLFVPKAERIDAIIAIDRWVFRSACRQLAAWQQRSGAANLQMSVNFSSKQFLRPELIELLSDILTESGVTPHSARIEITESGAIERSSIVSKILGDVRALGIQLHIDDFGMGFASLEALGHLTFDALKIDRSFIAKITTPNGLELVRSVISLAHNLGLPAIAEGVATSRQLDELQRLGCDFGQGFFFSEPLDGAAMDAYLDTAGYPRVQSPARPAYPIGGAFVP